MAEKLFITPQEMASKTVLGGNVDIDKYVFCIADTQISVIEPLLGTELYDKMIDDLTFPETYAGLYKILYDDFIVPITLNQSVANYIEIASYTVSNAGVFKHSPDNSEVVDKDEAQFLGGKYHNYAQMHVQRFNKWICKNGANITEYKTVQDEVNASTSLSVRSGWYLGSSEPKDCYYD
jgi:hypothetical protein